MICAEPRLRTAFLAFHSVALENLPSQRFRDGLFLVAAGLVEISPGCRRAAVGYSAQVLNNLSAERANKGCWRLRSNTVASHLATPAVEAFMIFSAQRANEDRLAVLVESVRVHETSDLKNGA